MIRAPMGDTTYWSNRVTKDIEWISTAKKLLAEPSKNPNFDPQFAYDLSKDIFRFILCRYSRGDRVTELAQSFPGLLDAWELSNKLAAELNTQLKPDEGWDHRHLLTAPQPSDNPRSHNDPRAWVFDLANLNHYIWCFWLVGLALSLEIPDEHWQRLLALIAGEGEDVLLDRVIATRQPGRVIGKKLLHVKPYARLLKAIDAPEAERPTLLKDFVESWYPELNRRGDEQPYWYIYGDPDKHPLEMGSYFGRWCIEAAVAAKVFNIDDSLCLGHEHYPGDLLRPEGPSTHKPKAKPGLFARLLGRK